MPIRSITLLGFLVAATSAAVISADVWRTYGAGFSSLYGLVLVGMVEVALFVLAGTAAAWLVDAGHVRRTLVAGAIAVGLGVGATAVVPDAAGAGLVIPAGLRSLGHGAVVVAAFALAARSSAHRWRPWAIGAMLVSALVGGQLAAFLFMLDLAAARAAVGIAVIGLAAAAALTSPQIAETRPAEPAARPMFGAVLLAAGLFALMVATDPTRAWLLLLTSAPDDIAGGYVTRSVLVVVGSASLGGGAWLGFRRLGASPAAWAIPVALAGAALAGTAMVSRVTHLAIGPDLAGTSVFAAPTLGVLIGILAGATAVARTGAVRVPAVLGAFAIVVSVASGLWLVASPPAPDSVVGLAASSLAIGGIGVGLVAAALRAVLADVKLGLLGAATGVGVVAMEVGSTAGHSVGTAATMVVEPGVPLPLVLAAAVSIAALAGALRSPRARSAGSAA